ncbi:hypothetical protein [Pseudooceanicola atlanticus]|uniref:Uncharacterized protein n=1 Tax=Pseudooceanicola atlanticus TaxID=1461694 RepID=A0A0A0EBM7_9RHOB|nr:hypothetical protein [Pseudooceanicola atlanticus]KGM47513.1 hypothetical protein ATO9_17980 [Pseudooceanicola atlanticus]
MGRKNQNLLEKVGIISGILFSSLAFYQSINSQKQSERALEQAVSATSFAACIEKSILETVAVREELFAAVEVFRLNQNAFMTYQRELMKDYVSGRQQVTDLEANRSAIIELLLHMETLQDLKSEIPKTVKPITQERILKIITDANTENLEQAEFLDGIEDAYQEIIEILNVEISDSTQNRSEECTA